MASSEGKFIIGSAVHPQKSEITVFIPGDD
jgi:hypothetical protein